jgi:hypothetical protein
MADWISAVATVVTAVIAYWAGSLAVASLRQQRTSSDVQLALGIFENINSYWDRLVDKPEDSTYNMGQILAHFEIASALFNRSILSDGALPILKDHIVEVFSRLQASEDGTRVMKECCSSSSTYIELRRFASKNFPTALKALGFDPDRPSDVEFTTAQTAHSPQSPAA